MPKRILMCKPTFFDIEYEINPWMDFKDPINTNNANKQWQTLHDIYVNKLGWDVQLIDPVEHLPDMVFTANGAIVAGKKVVLPTFRHPDRQPETEIFRTWFQDNGYADFLQTKYNNEGEGDVLRWNDVLFAGYPWRTTHEAHAEIADFLGLQVVGLQLSDARFYHLDTCLTIVNRDTVAVWPKALTPDSLQKLHEIVPNVIEASSEDALAYGLNAMSDGQNIVVPEGAHKLIAQYDKLGMNVYPLPIKEFQKSGGGVKCLTLELHA